MKAIGKNDFDEEGILQRFIVDSIIKFLSGVLIESTYFLTFDELSESKGYHPFAKNNAIMTYVDAIYFSIVTVSTIGYGDIFPILWVLHHITLSLVHSNGLITSISNKHHSYE
jgi:voltage-gated potassium channel Kch